MAYEKIIDVGWCTGCGRMRQVRIDTDGETGMTEITLHCPCGSAKPEAIKVYPFEHYELNIAPLFASAEKEEQA